MRALLARLRARVVLVLIAALCAAIAVLLATRGVGNSAPDFTLNKGRQAAFGNSGSSADIGDVRAAVRAALTDESLAGAMRDEATPALTPRERVALLAKNESTERAAKMAKAVEFALGERPFVKDGRFVVQSWEGVLAGKRMAKVYVTGYDRDRQVDGTAWVDTPYQARLLLVRSDTAEHGWLVTKVIATVQG